MSPDVPPRLLLVETSGRVGQLALAEGDRLLARSRLDEARRHARDLAPAVASLLAGQGWRAADLHLVAVSRGPGSYTGLRVGIISARTLAYATGCAILGVETFTLIAAQAPADVHKLAVLADAQQGKLYVQQFSRTDQGAWDPASSLEIMPLVVFNAHCPQDVCLTGPGLHRYADQLGGRRRLELGHWDPTSEGLLQRGLQRWQRGERDDLWTLEPLYARASSAEEKWQARASSGAHHDS